MSKNVRRFFKSHLLPSSFYNSKGKIIQGYFLLPLCEKETFWKHLLMCKQAFCSDSVEKTIKSGMDVSNSLKFTTQREKGPEVVYLQHFWYPSMFSKIPPKFNTHASFQDVTLNLALYIPIGKKAEIAQRVQNYLEWETYKCQIV